MDYLPKVKVSNQKESTQAQREFFRLGCFWDGIHDNILRLNKTEYPVIIYATQYGVLKWSGKDFRDTTIEELKKLQNKKA